MDNFRVAVIDANYLIYHAAWHNKDYPFEASSDLRNKMRELLERVALFAPKAVIAADSKKIANIRTSIYKAAVYKGTRIDDRSVAEIKEQLRESLMEFSVSVPGYEADDIAYTVALHNEDTLVVSHDKDLDNIPGWHYNPTKRSLYSIDAELALEKFWTQMLTGDRSDNVLGVPNIGPVKAGKLLNKCISEEDYYNAVMEAYRTYYKENGEYYFRMTFDTLKLYDVSNQLGDDATPRTIEELLAQI